MERSWPETFAERMRWSRKRAGYDRPTDAARALSIRPGTYRTYEADEGDGHREPPLTEIQRIARHYKVSWTWLAVGEGRPDQGVVADPKIAELNDAVVDFDPEDRDAALGAALAVVHAFKRRRL